MRGRHDGAVAAFVDAASQEDVALAAVRVLGPDALAPALLAGTPPVGEDLAVIARALAAQPAPATDCLDVRCLTPATRALCPGGAATGAAGMETIGDAAAKWPPNRRLAVANALRVLGLPSAHDWDALTARTWLGCTPDPWTLDWFTAYCVTHTVYHLTDWGSRPQGLPPHLVDYLHRWLPVWLEVWTEIRDWDLVSEFLLVDACLPEPRHPLAAWRALADAQHTTGYVPRTGEPGPRDQPQDQAGIFHHHQHTTCVAAMAGALSLHRADPAPGTDRPTRAG
ncbi:DUF6895 family protein [Actinomadura sp. LOL_011]|uniref:DUF6895 family protein n=1 Tax=Actinomadura sp. LOL_011 TaxID=3345410 RepID=UPI003A7F70E2